MFIVLKLNQSWNKNKKICWGVFLQIPKMCFFRGENKIVLKLKFEICISAFVLVKGSFIPIFIKKYWYLSPLEFFENKNFEACALGVHHALACRNFEFGLLKSCLTFCYLTCSVWSKKNSTLHPSECVYCMYVQYSNNFKWK